MIFFLIRQIYFEKIYLKSHLDEKYYQYIYFMFSIEKR